MKTKREARDHATNIATIRNQAVHIFKVKRGTAAYDAGYRFGTFVDEERAEYEAGGAVVLETIQPESAV